VIAVLPPNNNELSCRVVAATVLLEVPVRSNLLNQLPVVRVSAIELLPSMLIFGASCIFGLVHVVPNVNVLAKVELLMNPPNPSWSKFVALVMTKMVPLVDLVSTILALEKLSFLTTAPVDVHDPVVRVYPFKFRLPAVNVYVAVFARVILVARSILPDVCVKAVTIDKFVGSVILAVELIVSNENNDPILDKAGVPVKVVVPVADMLALLKFTLFELFVIPAIG